MFLLSWRSGGTAAFGGDEAKSASVHVCVCVGVLSFVVCGNYCLQLKSAEIN